MRPELIWPNRRARLAVFVVLAYALTWAFTIPFVYSWRNITDRHFVWWMIFFLSGAYGPTAAAIVVTASTQGRRGLQAFLTRCCRWRAPLGWWLFVTFAPMAVLVAAITVSGNVPAVLASLDIAKAWYVVPLALALALPFGPLPEEPGWRGFALPHLLRRHGILASSLTVGFFWTFWHTPMFWFPGAAIPSCFQLTFGAVLLFLAAKSLESITYTIVYLHTGGSVPIAITFHLFCNASWNIVFGLSDRPPDEPMRSIYLATVALHGILSLALLAWHVRTSRPETWHKTTHFVQIAKRGANPTGALKNLMRRRAGR